MPRMAAVEEEVREPNEESEEERWAEVAEGVLLVRRCSRRGWRLGRQCSGRGCWLTRTAEVVEEEAANVMEPVVVAGPLREAAGEEPEEVPERQMRAGEVRTWVVEVELKEVPKSG